MKLLPRLCSSRTAGLLPLIALTLGPIAGAQADLIEYAFTDAAGQQRSVLPGTVFSNPTGKIRFALSAGVDRKVRVSILESNGAVIRTATSSILGGSDRIEAGGKEYYGAHLDLTAPGEGSYLIRSEILSSDDVVVKSQTHDLKIDTTKPTASGVITWVARVSGGGSIDVFTNSGTGNEIRLDGLRDTASGLDSAVYYTRDEHGVEREFPVSIERTAGSVYLTMANAANAEIAPYDRHEYTIGFRVKDQAGNTADINRRSKIDRTVPLVRPQAYDSKAGAWTTYVPGMTVYDNPVKMRWIRSKTDHVAFNGTDYGWHDSTYDQQTTANIVHNLDVLYPASAGNFRLYTKAGGYYDQAYSRLEFNLAGGAAKAPTVLGVRYRLDGSWITSPLSGEVTYARFRSADRGKSIDRVIFDVEPRPYAQKITLSGFSSCQVEANASWCYINASIAEGEGSYYRDFMFSSAKADGSWSSRAGRLRVMWDTQAPIVESVTVDATAKTFTARIYDQDRINNSLRTEWDTTDLVARAIGSKTYTLEQTDLIETDYNRRTAAYDLSALPSGNYSVQITATDTYGNKTTKSAASVLIDNDSPLINIKTSSSAQQIVISTLDDVSIEVTDPTDPNPTVTGVELRGGPASETVRVSARPDGQGRFRIEYPIIFPTISAGEEYVLLVTARDAQGNTATEELKFSYEPAVIPLEGNLNIPAAPFAFTTSEGNPVIETQPLTLAAGDLVSGTYDVFATLRSDARSAFYIGGKLVSPGQTVTLANYDFSASGGRIQLPARPEVGGAAGTNGLLLSTSAPNTPVIVGSIRTWMPDISVSRSSDNPDQVITRQTISIGETGVSRCPITTDAAIAKAADPLRSPICLLEWKQVPLGLQEVSVEGTSLPLTMLEGSYQNAGDQAATFELSLFASDGAKRVIYRGEDSVSVREPFEGATFSHTLDGTELRRAVDSAELRFIQTSSPPCAITGNAEEARAAGMAGGPLTCLIQVTAKPDDLVQVSDSPLVLRGIIGDAGTHPVNWTASIYSQAGQSLLLQEGVSTIEVVHPQVETSLTMRVEESQPRSATPIETYPQAWTGKAYSITRAPLKGAAEASPEGFTYTPEAGFVGQDSFAYTVTDPSGMKAEGTATIDVVPFNLPPRVADISIRAKRMEVTRFALQASDENRGDTHRFEVVSGPVPAGIRATVVHQDLVIEPINHWVGTLHLTYRAIDRDGAASEPATAMITVEMGDQPPMVQDKTLVLQQDTVGKVMLSGWDADSPAPTIFEIAEVGQNISARILGNRVDVTPSPGWHGRSSIAYRAQDDGGLWSSPAVITIDVLSSSEDVDDQGSKSLQIHFKLRGLR